MFIDFRGYLMLRRECENAYEYVSYIGICMKGMVKTVYRLRPVCMASGFLKDFRM
jgi:hypothetical protein